MRPLIQHREKIVSLPAPRKNAGRFFSAEFSVSAYRFFFMRRSAIK
jgi:hypothetical protein